MQKDVVLRQCGNLELKHEKEARGEEADEGRARSSSGWMTRAQPEIRQQNTRAQGRDTDSE